MHEWLVTYAGSEKVLAEMLKEFPGADIYSLVDFADGKFSSNYSGKRFGTSFLQRFHRFPQIYRYLFPLMTIAVEQFDMSGGDLQQPCGCEGADYRSGSAAYQLLLHADAIRLGSAAPVSS